MSPSPFSISDNSSRVFKESLKLGEAGSKFTPAIMVKCPWFSHKIVRPGIRFHTNVWYPWWIILKQSFP